MPMKYALAGLLLFALSALHHAQPAAVEMTAAQVIDGLLSQDAGQKDRAATELAGISTKTAEEMGTELLRLGVREAQTVLGEIALANTANASVVALAALESEHLEIRSAGLDVFTRVSAAAASGAAEKGLNAKRIEALRKLLDGGQYLKKFCEGVRAETGKGANGPVEEAMRLVVFLDRKLGVRGWTLLLRHCAELMQGHAPGEDVSPAAALQAEKLRRGAALTFEAIWVADPATQFNFHPTASYDDRVKAITKVKRVLDEFEKREVELGDKKFTGLRYGDYLWELFSSDVTETRSAAYLRFKWWRGDEGPIIGEGYPEAVDRLNAMGRREVSQLRRELRNWWQDYRARSE